MVKLSEFETQKFYQIIELSLFWELVILKRIDRKYLNEVCVG